MTGRIPTIAEEIEKQWCAYSGVSPYNQELKLLLHSPDPDWCVLGIGYREDLVGDPLTGAMHGGVITALLDAAFGVAVRVRLPVAIPMVTLDLRIDHVRPATPGRMLFGGAVCHKVTADFAFVRGAAYHDTPDDPIAVSIGVFMFPNGAPVLSREGLPQ